MSDNNNGSCRERNLSRLRSKRSNIVSVSAQKERNLSIKKIYRILRKDESKRTKEETDLLSNYSEIVKEAGIRLQKREKLKERLKEIEDNESVIDEKCKKLAEALSKAEYLVVYTGAGISTSAQIPDYRGASGIWTLLQQGKDIGSHDLTQAEPTYTHMALSQLYLHGKLKHVVSQNCDGLHLRSGLPKRALSEVHGNMYIEVCRSCRPIVEYLRLFDVTEYTARYSHKTMRRCYKCNNPLVDSIVHFGERGNLPWPLNWKGACKAAEKADVILCMGSSLKVLKRYPWLWSMDKPAVRRPHLYIVNLQWTPKDYQAIIKINGKCDNVMKKVMKHLSINVPGYSRKLDPLFTHATLLCKEEEHTTNRPFLSLIQTEMAKDSEDTSSSESDMLLSEIAKNIKSEPKDECLDSSTEIRDIKIKHEVNGEVFVNDLVAVTCQSANGVKSIKEELILITVKSSEEIGDCCSSYKCAQVHDKICQNFIDENLDIPIIMHDDLPASEKLKNIISSDGIKTEIVEPKGTDCTEPSQSTGYCCYSQKTTSLSNILNLNKTQPANAASVQIIGDNKIVRIECNKRISDHKDEISRVKKIKYEVESSDQKECSRPLTWISNTGNCKHVNKNGRGNTKQSGGGIAINKKSNCSFCLDNYLSASCLFYVKMEPVFKTGLPHCECCGDDSDDSGDDQEANDTGEKASKGKEGEGAAEGKVKDAQKVVNPGWYGKGCRKRFRRK